MRGFIRILLPIAILVVACSTLMPALAVCAQSATNIARIKVTDSNINHLQFSVTDLDYKWTSVLVPGSAEPMFSLTAKGLIPSAKAGHPLLPGTGSWVVVPPGTRPVLNIISENWQKAANQQLTVATAPVLIDGRAGEQSIMSELLVLPGHQPPADADIPEHAKQELQTRGQARNLAAVELGKTTSWRGRRIVPISFVPVRHNEQGMATELLKGGSWEIKFVADKNAEMFSTESAHQKKLTSRGDAQFSHVFLNAGMIDKTPTEAGWLRSKGKLNQPFVSEELLAGKGTKSGSPLLDGYEAKLFVLETGLVKVTYERLNDRGYLPPGMTIAESQIRLYQRRYLPELDDGTGAPYYEVEVPIQMVGEGDNFSGDDFFLFYGLRLRDDLPYTQEGTSDIELPGAGDPFERNNKYNSYWLVASEPDTGQPWARMAVGTLPIATGTPLESYRRSEHHEEQVVYRENIPNKYQDVLYYSDYESEEVNIGIGPLSSPAPDGADCSISVALAASRMTGTADVTLSLFHGTELAELLETTRIDSDMAQEVHNYTVPAGSLIGEGTKIHMVPNVSILFCYLNWVKIEYDALYQATNNKLNFHGGPAAGQKNMEVSGFTDSDLCLVEISDIHNPVFYQLNTANIVPDSDTWKLSISVEQTGPQREFVAVSDWHSNNISEFVFHKSEILTEQIDPTEVDGDDPELIVVTHPDFRQAINRWVEHRKARAGGNLAVHVVETPVLYDWYSGGFRDPWAIKRFTNHALNNWGSKALVLVGDANENSREIGVTELFRPWSTDWVPTHTHIQKVGGQLPEHLASDKWFVTQEAGTSYPEDNYPINQRVPISMFVGRFPCNSVTDLNNIIDKIMIMENVQSGQEWRRKTVFMSDDMFSESDTRPGWFSYHSGESRFINSEREAAGFWSTNTPVGLQSVELYLEDWLNQEWPDQSDRRDSLVRPYTAANATPPMMAALNSGALVVHYQGHGNSNVLSSEYWFQDHYNQSEHDVALLSNSQAPWVFFGMGCHISAWAKATVRGRDPSLGEKVLTKAGGGACATVGSSGFEYVVPNSIFTTVMFDRWTSKPPKAIGPTSPGKSRWVLGELLWATDMDLLARPENNTDMVAQFLLLGDPMMVLDAGEPEVTATLLGESGQQISGTIDLLSIDATNTREISIVALDEAGIDRIKVIDSDGVDLTSQIVTESLPAEAENEQEVHYDLEVPIRAFDHSITVSIYDAAATLDSDRHYELVLNIPVIAQLLVGTEIVELGDVNFTAGESISMTLTVNSAAWVDADEPMMLRGENLSVRDVSFSVSKGNEVSVSFVATALEGSSGERSVILTINGRESTFILQGTSQVDGAATISQVVNYPNPMSAQTRFLFETGAAASEGLVSIYSLAGSQVRQIQFNYSGGGSGIVDWDGRDSERDNLANGVYLYRLELKTTAGSIYSDMQRLVIMH